MIIGGHHPSAAPRDFVDVFRLAARYDKATLVEWARQVDRATTVLSRT